MRSTHTGEYLWYTKDQDKKVLLIFTRLNAIAFILRCLFVCLFKIVYLHDGNTGNGDYCKTKGKKYSAKYKINTRAASQFNRKFE